MEAPRPLRTDAGGSRLAWAGPALIAAAGWVCYSGSLHVPLLMDDDRSIARNASLRHLWPPGSVLAPPPFSGVSGRPVLNLSFALNYAVGGLDVFSYHAVNLALHVLAGLTLAGIVRRTLRVESAALLGFAAGLLWTVHPLQTQSVTYISERAEVLAGLFYLLALYAFIRGRRALSVVACLLGMATKESTVTAPFLIFAYDAVFVAGGPAAAWRARRGYYLALAGTWLALAALMLGFARRSVGFRQGVGPLDYALTEGGAILRYLRLALWPRPLIFDYGPALTAGTAAWAAGAVVLVLVAAAAWSLRRSPRAGFLALAFFVLLAPSSSFVPVVLQPVAENRMYLPLAAVIVGLLLAARRLLGRGLPWFVAAAALAAIAATRARNSDYRDPLSLWSDTVRKRPGNYRAWDSLGDALAHAGRRAEAIDRFHQALALAPDAARIHYNVAKALNDEGRTGEAVAEYRAAVRLDPGYAEARVNLATALAKEERWPEAREQLRAAARLEPGDGRIRSELGVIELAEGQLAAAREDLAAALRLDPSDAEAHLQLGNALGMGGELPAAVAQWSEALRLRPNDPVSHNNLATALLQLGQAPEALAHYREAVRLRPDYQQARANLADLEARLGAAGR
ncbi:MAG TPA: tetratricopeptide repeat protein [Opitutaceae bacterium]|nr:tetratricopeptide repeat protein [Opitutaceae bacterium]